MKTYLVSFVVIHTRGNHLSSIIYHTTGHAPTAKTIERWQQLLRRDYEELGTSLTVRVLSFQELSQES